jgi:hypothetical protein
MSKFNSDNLYILYWEYPEDAISYDIESSSILFSSIQIHGLYINEEEALEDQRLYNKNLLYESYRGLCCARIVKNYKYEPEYKNNNNNNILNAPTHAEE